MENECSTTVPKQALRKTNVMCSVYWGLYVVSKLGMFYTMFQENWVGLIGFGIATGVSYVEMMKRS